MATRKPAEMSNEELLKNEKVTRMAIYMMAVSSVISLAAGIYLSFKKGFSALVIIPVSFMPLLIINLNSLKMIKKEKEARGIK